MAKNETTRKTKSNELHQFGEASQHASEQDLAINRKGVAMQCIIHNVLAAIPSLSVLKWVRVIQFSLNATVLQK